MEASPFVTHQDNAKQIMRGVKVSMPKVDVGENVDAWEQQARDTLMAQHPWVSKITVNAVLTATSEDGYAIGFFHLTPRNIPASATGEDRINVVSVPIIIGDFKLAPLDVYLYKDQFYPLSEERAMRLLRLPDIFIESDRDPSSLTRTLMGATAIGGGSRDRGFSAGFDGGNSLSNSLKFASATPHLGKEVRSFVAGTVGKDLTKLSANLRQLKADIVSNEATAILDICHRDPQMARVMLAATEGVPLPQKTSVAHAIVTPEDGYRATAELAGVEVLKTSATIQTRDYWRSSPTTGKPSISPWEPTTYHKVSQALGNGVAQTVLDQGYAYVSLDGQGVKGSLPQEVLRGLRVGQAEKVSELHEPGWLFPLMAKESSLSGVAPAQKLLFVNQKEILGLPKSFEGYVVNGVTRSSLGDSRMAILTTDGDLVIPASQYGDMYDLDIMSLGSEQLSSLPEIKTIRKYIPFGSTNVGDYGPFRTVIWMTKGSLYGVLVRPGSINLDGETYYRASYSDVPNDSPQAPGSDVDLQDTLVGLDGQFLIHTEETRGPRTIIHAPKGAKLVEVNLPHTADVTTPGPDGEQLKTSTRIRMSHAQPIRGIMLKEGQKATAFAPQWGAAPRFEQVVKVSASRVRDGAYRLEHPVLARIGMATDELDDRQFKVALSFAGMSSAQINDVLGAVKADDGVQFEVEAPPFGEGAVLVKEAQALAEAKRKALSVALRAIDTKPMLHVVKVAQASAPSSDKLSGSIMGMTVDAALSLNFLNPGTLIKFVDMRPDLEAALSKVCALLVASRLGLTEVPEQALELAMTSLEPVLRGLRSLEMSVRKL